jgi:hypothetical protein
MSRQDSDVLLVVGIPFDPRGSTTYLEKLSELKAITGADLAKLVRTPGAYCAVLDGGGVAITPSGYITILFVASVVVLVRWGFDADTMEQHKRVLGLSVAVVDAYPALKTSPYASWCDMQASMIA